MSWLEANQQHLMLALARVRALIERSDPAAAQQAWEESARALPAPSTLEALCGTFGLTTFERDVILLCAGVELDAAFAALVPGAQPTFGMAMAILPEAHWSALLPAAPLRRFQLVELLAADSLTRSPLKLDERVLHFLTGVSSIDERLRPYVEQVGAAPELPLSQRALADRITRAWAPQGQAPPAIQLCGQDPAAKRAIAATACERLGLRLYALRADELPHTPAERDGIARLWEREAILGRAALLIDGEDVAELSRAAALAERIQSWLLVMSGEPLRLRRPSQRLDVRKPSVTEQEALWRATLGPLADRLNGHIERVVGQFSLGTAGLRAAAGEVAESDPPDGAALWEACRTQARPRLDDLAQRIDSHAGWEDLVLPASQLQTLQEMAAHVRRRAQVYEEWGFGRKSGRGLGLSGLFCGASGTGKTLAAEVLAAALALDLYRIDLSQVVSKYIGETEKNLRRIFDAAEEGGALLLFDEADALFGKRSEVKDSHDRYANIEVSYLLQRMEAYRGLAILTTNMRNALDPAFMRRITFIVNFPFPDVRERAAIWRRVFPPGVPTDGLDVDKLARLSIAGGNIRNIALGAAFVAADAGEPVRMGHLLRAARGEYAKLERPLTEAESGGWS
jgi:hypothetical protein